VIGLVEYEEDDDDGDRFDARRRSVLLFVAFELSSDTKVYFTKGILADVRGPQLGERLAHRTDGVLHRSRSNGFTFWGVASIAVALREDLYDGDGVVPVADEGFDVVFQAELFPTGPMRLRCFGAFSSDAKSGLFLDKAEIKAESVAPRSWNCCQGIVCGKARSK
jgi:hypothetical protein